MSNTVNNTQSTKSEIIINVDTEPKVNLIIEDQQATVLPTHEDDISLNVESGYENNYNKLKNKPSINGTMLVGDISADELGLQTNSASDIDYIDNLDYEVSNVQEALDKAFDTLDNKVAYKEFTEQVGNISDLRTEDTSNVVNAINDVNARLKQLPTTVPFIPQTKISQLVMDGVKYLKIEWTNNQSFLRYQGSGQAFLYLYKYTKTGCKKWIRDEQEITHSGVKKWVHPANKLSLNTNHQCWGIRSFEANPTFAEKYSIDEIIDEAEYPIANDGYVKTEYPLSVDQASVLIPLNDIVSPILKVAHIGTDMVVLPCEGDGLEVKLMGVKQNKNKGRCNQPMKFCLAVKSASDLYVGSCLNIATIQLFKYRVTEDNHHMHGYDTRYSLLPDIGYSVYIK